MRVLLDQGTPLPLRLFLAGHTVSTAASQGWAQLRNGDLLDAAEDSGFEIFLTTDRNIKYQQNLKSRSIAIVVLSKQQWPQLRAHVQLVADAVDGAVPGACVEIEIP